MRWEGGGEKVIKLDPRIWVKVQKTGIYSFLEEQLLELRTPFQAGSSLLSQELLSELRAPFVAEGTFQSSLSELAAPSRSQQLLIGAGSSLWEPKAPFGAKNSCLILLRLLTESRDN